MWKHAHILKVGALAALAFSFLSLGLASADFSVEIIADGSPLVNQPTSIKLVFSNNLKNGNYNVTVIDPDGNTAFFNESIIPKHDPSVELSWTPTKIGNHIITAYGWKDNNKGKGQKNLFIVNSKIVSPVPEMDTWVLVAVGLLGLFGLAKVGSRKS